MLCKNLPKKVGFGGSWGGGAWGPIVHGRLSVIGGDQPLCDIIQWQYPDTLGEDKMAVMMGALHIEDKMHVTIGKLLRDSGWTTVVSQAGDIKPVRQNIKKYAIT